MRADLVTVQILRSLPESLLEASSDALPLMSKKDAECNDFGFSEIFALPHNRRAIGIRSNLLGYESQKAQEL